jgi:hypothetical protein
MCGDANICHHPAEKDLYIVAVIAAGAPVAHKKQVVPMEGRVDLPLIPSAVFRNGIADWENPVLSVFGFTICSVCPLRSTSSMVSASASEIRTPVPYSTLKSTG